MLTADKQEMVCVFLLSVLLVQFGQLFPLSNAIVVEDVTSCAWDGVIFYISVRRDGIQKKLDSLYASVCSESGNGKCIIMSKVHIIKLTAC